MNILQQMRTSRLINIAIAEAKADEYNIRAEMSIRECLKEERWYITEIAWMQDNAMREPYLYLGECAIVHLATLHAGHVEIKRELAKRGYVRV